MSQTTNAVIAELMDRRLLNDVDDDLHQEIAEAVIQAARLSRPDTAEARLREALDVAHGKFCKIAGTEVWTDGCLDGWRRSPGALREYAERAASEIDNALSPPSGGDEAKESEAWKDEAAELCQAHDDLDTFDIPRARGGIPLSVPGRILLMARQHQQERSRLIDEASYSDLKASGGLFRRPSDDDCEDQGLCTTDVCTKFECQTFDNDTKIVRPKLIWKEKYWVCPKCHSSYGALAKGIVSPSEPSPTPDRREIVAWFKDRIDKYATQLNATGQADVAHLLRRDAQIILAALDVA